MIEFGPLGSAVFSNDRAYRYLLSRGEGRARPVWIMLNPSYATGYRNDHTITKCIEFSRLWGYNGLFVVNLFALISTDPRVLLQVKDPVGPANNTHLKNLATYAWDRDVPVIAAWGNNVNSHRSLSRVETVKQVFPALYCLGITNKGQPKHPLRLAYKTELQKWQ